jgi:mRNA-degrading endonuclease RelE of RelBE toxin-antitoxin system
MLIIRSVSLTPHFVRSFIAMPSAVQKAFGKQLGLLLRDTMHPSLDVKLYAEERDIWQARVTRGYRLYFTVEHDHVTLHEIKAHE